MKLAYQTNTWGGVVGHPAGVTSIRDLYYLANGSTEEALRDISSVGYAGFELFDGNLIQYADRKDELRSLMQNLHLEMVAVYAGANFIYPDVLGEELVKIEHIARLAAEFNATYLVVGGGAVRSTGIVEQDYQQLGQALDQVAELARRIGLVATYHPHLGTCVQAPDQLEKLFKYTSIGLCPDTAHVQAGGGDPTAILRHYASRVNYIHLKDIKHGTFVPLGQGEQNYSEILAALRDAGYDGWITVELDSFPDPKRGAEISKAFIQQVIAAA
ncbi:MAG: sugar phosphate isomerase/epimerase [Chloroflexota bacterium]|nr:sugar phosphate isomerase/epimerase [Chloroflexota bacterium]